jgi:L-ascorbate metabolism protein UlaG (beta-lactamase superfamily)
MKSFWPLPLSWRGWLRVGFAWLITLSLAAPAAEPAGSPDRVATPDGDLLVYPVQHASLVLTWKDVTIYVDPVGGAALYGKLPRPDLILLTDIHPDHLDGATLAGLATEKTRLVAPPLVRAELSGPLGKQTDVLSNGQSTNTYGLKIEAIPMYNLTPERLKFHPKGRGNGYVVSLGSKRIYLSGDTEDTREMKALRNIDVAFVCMNLPYTMDVEQAAVAVLAFRPKIVYPYHSRGSDLAKFKAKVGADSGIEVRLLKWY